MADPFYSRLEMKTVRSAEPTAAALLEQAKQKTGMIPNLYGFMANAPALLDVYQYGIDQFRARSGFSAVEQEVVLLSISFENGCESCMAAHSVIAYKMSRVPQEVTDAIRKGQISPDERLEALSRFTRLMVQTRGRSSTSDVDAFLSKGFAEERILDVILAIGLKTLSNYTNHVCRTPLDAPFVGREWKSPVGRV